MNFGNSLRNNRTDKVEVNEDTEVAVLSDVKNSHVGHNLLRGLQSYEDM